jgi:hypothetical protein
MGYRHAEERCRNRQGTILFEPGRLRRVRQRRLLPIGAVHLMRIARDAFLDLLHAPLHLGAREVPVAVVHNAAATH